MNKAERYGNVELFINHFVYEFAMLHGRLSVEFSA